MCGIDLLFQNNRDRSARRAAQDPGLLRVPHPIRASNCSPPHFAVTQLRSATGPLACSDSDLHRAVYAPSRAHWIAGRARNECLKWTALGQGFNRAWSSATAFGFTSDDRSPGSSPRNTERTTRRLLDLAGLKPDDGHGGAVTLIERFGRAANLNMHLHCLVLDGVYRRSAEGAPQFVEVAAPSDEALEAVLLTAPVNRHASCGCEPSMETLFAQSGAAIACLGHGCCCFRPGLGAGLHGAESALGRVGYGGARRYACPMDRACRSSAASLAGHCYAA